MATKDSSKPLTPAQTAKPLGSSAKAATSPTAKKAEAGAPESAAAIAQNDTIKAIEKLEIRTKAVYVKAV